MDISVENDLIACDFQTWEIAHLNERSWTDEIVSWFITFMEVKFRVSKILFN